jgi:CubicO group peptidase (beta-lactamase class C family)
MRRAFPFLLLAGVVFSGCFLLRVPAAMERERSWEEDQTWTFQHMSELFPTRTISRAGKVTRFERAPVALEEIRFTLAGNEVGFEQFWKGNQTAGMVVLHRGRLVFERYDLGADETTRFTSWSVAKSFASALVGLALGEGHIGSLDEPIEKYLPEVVGTGYEGVTIGQTLQMSSGVRFSEEYDASGSSDVIDFMTNSLYLSRTPANALAIDFPRTHPPGTVFNYNTAETQVLAWVVQRATGENPADYLEEKLWRRLGMEHDAIWLLDIEGKRGMEMGGCCLNMALRDQARFGQLFLQDGVWEGERVLPEGWVARATVPSEAHLRWDAPTPYAEHGYQHQWWSIGTGAFSAEGVHGQFIYVDPARDVVIAKASSWPEAWTDEHGAMAFAAFDAIAKHLAK